METVKKSSKKRKSSSSAESGIKKTKRQDYTDDEFKESLKKSKTAHDGLVKFIEQAKLFPSDTQYDIIANYCDENSDCSDILQLFESLVSNSKSVSKVPAPDQDTADKIVLIIDCLQLILMRIADDLVEFTPGANLVARRMLKVSNLQCILGQLKVHNKVEHIKSALLLLTTLTSVSASAAAQVMTQFEVISNHLLKLLYRKHDPADVKSRVVQFIISFLVTDDYAVIRHLLTVKGFVNTVVTGLKEHQAHNIVLMLTALHDKVVCNTNISKTTKTRVFNETVLISLGQLLLWRTSQHPNANKQVSYVSFTQIDPSSFTSDQILVRNASHKLLMALCTSVKHGIIFHDKMFASTTQNSNHVLTNFLGHLRSPHLDPLARELVVNALAACPDVLQWYLPTLQQSCALRLSLGCLSMLRFINQIYELQPLVSSAVRLSKVSSSSQLAAVIVSTLVPPKEIWTCYVSAMKVKQSKANKAENRSDDEDDGIHEETSDLTAIEHEAFGMLLLVLKRTAATLTYVQKNSPWGTISGTVVNIIRDSITKLSPAGYVVIDYWIAAQKGMKSRTETQVVKPANISVLPTIDSIDRLLTIVKVLCGYTSIMPSTIYRLSDQFHTNDFVNFIWSETCKSSSVDAVSDLHLHTLKLLVAIRVSLVSLLEKVSGAQDALSLLLHMVVKMKSADQTVACKLINCLLSRSGLFISANDGEVAVWLNNLLTCGLSQADQTIPFFVSCVNAMHQNSSDFVHSVLNSMSDAQTTKNTLFGDQRSSVDASLIALEDIMNGEEIDLMEDSQDKSTKVADASNCLTILPFSGLTTASISMLDNNKETSDEVLNYVDSVITTLLYQQQCPLALCYVLHNSKAGKLLPRVSALLQKLLPNQKVTCLKPVDSTSTAARTLENLFITGESVESFIETFAMLPSLPSCDCFSLAQQLLLYIHAHLITKIFTPKRQAISKQAVKEIDQYLNVLTIILEQCKSNTQLIVNKDSLDSLDVLLKDFENELITDDYRSFSRVIFKSEYMSDLFLAQHGRYCDHKLLSKLSKTVTRHLSVLAKSLSETNADVSDVIDPRHTDKLSAVLTEVISGSRLWTVDLIHVVDGFWSVLSSSLRCNLLASLVNQPSDCLEDLDETGNCNLNSRGLLVIRLLNIMSTEDWSRITSEVISSLFEIVKRVPSDETLCESMSRSVSIAPRMSHNRIVPETCLMLLKNSHQSALTLVLSLSQANATCRQSLVNWFMTKSKRWSKPEVLPIFSQLITRTLKSLKQDNEEKTCAQFVFDNCWQVLLNKLCGKENDEIHQSEAELFVFLTLHLASGNQQLQSWRKIGRTLKKCASLPQLDVYNHLSSIVLDDGQSIVNTDLAARVIATCAGAFLVRDSSQRDERIISIMSDFVKKCDASGLIQHLSDVWQQFLTEGLRHCYISASFLHLLDRLITLIYSSTEEVSEFSPSVASLFEMVVSHSAFLSTIFSETAAANKDSLLSLLISLVSHDPSCCQSSHLVVYLSAYHASLSTADQKILILLNLYEKNGCELSTYRPYLWGEKFQEYHTLRKTMGPSLCKQPTAEDVLDLLDKARLQQSLVHFPLGRSVELSLVAEDNSTLLCDVAIDCYDPAFILPLLAHLTAPDCVVQCTQFAQRQCLGYLLVALSSHVQETRALAYHVLGQLHGHLEAAVGQQSTATPSMLLYLLDCLRYSVAEPNFRLPCITTTFLSRTSYILTTPEDHMYSILCEFLLLKPSIDLSDVPEFYKLFYSSRLEYKVERSWVLGMIIDGMREYDDYKICERRFLLKILLSLYDSPLGDTQTQSLVIKYVQQMCSIGDVANDLIEKRGLLAWLTHSAASGINEVKLKSLSSLVMKLQQRLANNELHLRPSATLELQLTYETLARFNGSSGLPVEYTANLL